MLILRDKLKILYLNGLGADKIPDRPIDRVLESTIGRRYSLTVLSPNYDNPLKVYSELLEISKNCDVIIGLSMGGFFTEILPHSSVKIFINPALELPERIPAKIRPTKPGQELEKLSKLRFKYQPEKILGFFSTEDKLLEEGGLKLLKLHHPGSTVYRLEGSKHLPEVPVWEKFICPKILEFLRGL